jgi:hypothetical protein
MEVEQLARLIERPETHSRLLGGYRGAYSLGVGSENGDPVLILQVEGTEAATFPRELRVGRETVPVRVRAGFNAPRPLGSRGR